MVVPVVRAEEALTGDRRSEKALMVSPGCRHESEPCCHLIGVVGAGAGSRRRGPLVRLVSTAVLHSFGL